jgi:predicted RNA-binding Zn-ribbon protein involved in translation (DUF1610 family)
MAKCANCGFQAPIWEWRMEERWEGLFHFTDYVCPKCGAKNKLATEKEVK